MLTRQKITQFNQHSTLFITGTDTGVGKSIVTAILALSCHQKGKKVAISKPLQTGEEKDTDFLKSLTNNQIPIFNTYSFKLPAAPSVAAAHEDKEIDIEKIISNIKKLEKEFDHVIVEGIGGLAVPILENLGTRESGNQKHSTQCSALNAQHYLVADLIKDLNYQTIIASRPSLGTINHSILTIEFAKQKSLNILGFIVSGYNENTKDPVIKTAPDEISKITGAECLRKIPMVRLTYELINSLAKDLDFEKEEVSQFSK